MSKTMTFETTARTIGECFPYIKNGANIKQAKEGKGIPITRIETISGGTFHRDRMGYANIHDTEKYKNWILHDGDILMSHINSIPNMGRAVEYKAEEGETIIHGMNLLALRADRTIVIPGYADIYFSSTIFRNYVFRITKKAVNQASFSIKDLKTIPIPLPSLEAQRAIAQQFTQINALHRALLQKTDCLDAVTKSRFVEMFGDPIENDSKLPKCKWEDVLTIVNGKNQKKVECATGEYPICGSGGEMGRARQYLTKGDSVIIGRKGNINNPILMREPFWNVDTAFGLEPNAEILIVEYLYYYCEWFDFQKLNKAVTIPSLTKADLLKIEMPLPPLALQQEFAAFVSQVDKLRFDDGPEDAEQC